jgi:hypothetical protein
VQHGKEAVVHTAVVCSRSDRGGCLVDRKNDITAESTVLQLDTEGEAMKKLLLVLLAILVASTLSCGRKDHVTAPLTPTTSDYSALEVQGQLYQQWIERMDPFVSMNKDGTYRFDATGFQKQYGRMVQLNPSNREIVNTLKAAIPFANADMKSEAANTCAGSTCWSWWWGKKCCYWGDTAQWLVAAVSVGAAVVPVIGKVASVYAAVMGGYLATHGRFCLKMIYGTPLLIVSAT